MLKHPEFRPLSSKTFAGLLLVVVALTAIDLGTKAWAYQRLSTSPVSDRGEVCEPNAQGVVFQQRRALLPIILIDGYLEFRYAENCGAAFGFLNRAPAWLRKGVFYAAAILASVFLLWIARTGRGSKLFVWSVPLIVAGASGNFVDRVRLGYVVDFIRFHTRDGLGFIPAGWAYPTFNVADIWITVGVVLIVIDGILESRRDKERPSSKDLII